jgi:hypothetical protein
LLRGRTGSDLGFFLGFTREPDDRFRWVVISELAAEIGDVASGGRAETWDDAKLSAIEDLYLPSAEGSGGEV